MSVFLRSVRLIHRSPISSFTPRTRTISSMMLQMMENPRPLTLDDGPLVWIDCEMTGLDYKKDILLEIAVIITNGDLKRVHEGISHVIQTPKQRLDEMDEWCIKTHRDTGLTKECIESTKSHEWVEADVLNYIKQWVPEMRTGVLAGSSVHADRQCFLNLTICFRTFLLEYMPSITDWLHYRCVLPFIMIELKRRWYPKLERSPNDYFVGGVQHRAMDDIQASILELQWYRTNLFRQLSPPTTGKQKHKGGL
ncbi:ribonuclease H-like protein [Serendipita vermifera]|nr:ribonuclease H-like protein [Serendipita vermifera]